MTNTLPAPVDEGLIETVVDSVYVQRQAFAQQCGIEAVVTPYADLDPEEAADIKADFGNPDATISKQEPLISKKGLRPSLVNNPVTDDWDNFINSLNGLQPGEAQSILKPVASVDKSLLEKNDVAEAAIRLRTAQALLAVMSAAGMTASARLDALSRPGNSHVNVYNSANTGAVAMKERVTKLPNGTTTREIFAYDDNNTLIGSEVIVSRNK